MQRLERQHHRLQHNPDLGDPAVVIDRANDEIDGIEMRALADGRRAMKPGHDKVPELKCGDCLFNDTEVVALKVTPLRGLSRYELAFKAAYHHGERGNG